MRLPVSLRLLAGPRVASWAGAEVRYQQGQRPDPRTREYFYYLDQHGQLFLDDTKVKNFTTCFRDVSFLVSFFSRLEPNGTGRHAGAFPFLSRCGRERNFLRCQDRPLVFTALIPPEHRPHRSHRSHRRDTAGHDGEQRPLQHHDDTELLSQHDDAGHLSRHDDATKLPSRHDDDDGPLSRHDDDAGRWLLSYCGGGARLALPFQPGSLALCPRSGRLYHAAPAALGGVGLVRWTLAESWGDAFEFHHGPERPPTHFWWDGRRHRLTGELLPLLSPNVP